MFCNVNSNFNVNIFMTILQFDLPSLIFKGRDPSACLYSEDVAWK